MLFLAISSLRSRWVTFIGVFATVAAAVALVTATGSLLESGIRGDVPPERLTGTEIIVTADQSISETHGEGDAQETVGAEVSERLRLAANSATKIATVAGVADTTLDVSFSAHVMSNDGTMLDGPAGGPSEGHAWSSATITPFVLSQGEAPASKDDVVLDAELASRADVTIGDDVDLVVAGDSSRATVVGLATPKVDGTNLRGQSALFFSDDAAAAYYGHLGQVDLIGVAVDPRADPAKVADDVRDKLGPGFSVYTGNDRGKAEYLDAADTNLRLIAISGSLAGIGLFVAILVLSGMLALFVQQRQREIALLRAMGATTRQVRRMLAREALIVTVVGVLAGLWPGVLLASTLSSAMKERGLLPATFASHTGLLPMAAAFAAAVVVSQAACFFAGRRAARIRPVEALVDAAAPRRSLGVLRTLLGLLALGGTAALFVVTRSVSATIAPAVVPGLFLAAVTTLALFAPLVATAGSRILGLLMRGIGASGYLATANTRAQTRRLASAMTPLALTVGIAGMTVFQQTTLDREAQTQGNDRLVADHVVAASSGLRPAAIDDLAAESHGTVVGVASTTVYANYELDPYAARAVTPGDLGAVLDLGVTEGSLGDLDPDEVALSTDAVDSMGGAVGEPIHIRLGDGTEATPTVVATYERPLGFADVVLPWKAVESHLTEPLLSAVLLHDGSDRASSAAALRSFAAAHPEVVVGGVELVRASEDANADTQAWVNYVLLGMVIVFAAFAVVNTLMLSIGERVREFALLRLVGTTRRQVLTMMRYEAAVVAILGLLFGAVIAAATVIPFSKAVTGSYAPEVSLMAVGLLAAAAGVLAWAGTMLPARGALRPKPVDAIGIRE